MVSLTLTHIEQTRNASKCRLEGKFVPERNRRDRSVSALQEEITGHLLSPVCLKHPLLHSILSTAQCEDDGVTRQTSGNVTEICPVCLGPVTASDQVELFDICAVL